MKEIERKFLISGYPTGLPVRKKVVINQSYLRCDNIEVRVTKEVFSRTEYHLTVKGPGTLSRVEVPTVLAPHQYDELLKLVDGPIIVKDCICYELEPGIFMDVCKVDNDILYAEIEFNTEVEARKFKASHVPNLIKEVTDDPAYYMKNYWKKKREAMKQCN